MSPHATGDETSKPREDIKVIQARIDLAFAKHEALVNSWVTKFDTSKCAPDKTAEEIAEWDAELYNPRPLSLGLGYELPKEAQNSETNRKDLKNNEKLRKIMLGRKGGLNIAKPRDAEEKMQSRKRAQQGDSSEDEEGRSSMIKSKKVKRFPKPAAPAVQPSPSLAAPSHSSKDQKASQPADKTPTATETSANKSGSTEPIPSTEQASPPAPPAAITPAAETQDDKELSKSADVATSTKGGSSSKVAAPASGAPQTDEARKAKLKLKKQKQKAKLKEKKRQQRETAAAS
jgi:hypothetical protein